MLFGTVPLTEVAAVLGFGLVLAFAGVGEVWGLLALFWLGETPEEPLLLVGAEALVGGAEPSILAVAAAVGENAEK
jgi:hypothetical protein